MRTIEAVILFCAALAIAGCSAVPGDAAQRAGQPDAAADLYKRGADQGDAAAAMRLAFLIESGRVGKAQYGESGDWFKRACTLGNSAGCHNVGVAYEYEKNGLPKNLAEARNYYQIAAEKGYMQSQYNLASMYSNNYVNPSNDVEGMKWMLLAQLSAEKCREAELCKWISQDPPGHKKKLASRLTDSQLREANSLAVQWKAKP